MVPMAKAKEETGKKRGRPFGDPAKVRSQAVMVLLTVAEKERLVAEGTKQGVPIGTLAYQYVLAGLERAKPGPKKGS